MPSIVNVVSGVVSLQKNNVNLTINCVHYFGDGKRYHNQVWINFLKLFSFLNNNKHFIFVFITRCRNGGSKRIDEQPTRSATYTLFVETQGLKIKFSLYRSLKLVLY